MEDIITFAGVLDGCGAFNEPRDVIYFFEKPGKWRDEHARWMAMGKPLDLDDLQQLQGPF